MLEALFGVGSGRTLPSSLLQTRGNDSHFLPGCVFLCFNSVWMMHLAVAVVIIQVAFCFFRYWWQECVESELQEDRIHVPYVEATVPFRLWTLFLFELQINCDEAIVWLKTAPCFIFASVDMQAFSLPCWSSPLLQFLINITTGFFCIYIRLSTFSLSLPKSIKIYKNWKEINIFKAKYIKENV